MENSLTSLGCCSIPGIRLGDLHQKLADVLSFQLLPLTAGQSTTRPAGPLGHWLRDDSECHGSRRHQKWLQIPICSSHEQDHSLMSVEGGLYSCRQCSYVTKKSGHMRRHLCKHTGERPFQCHLCPAAFVQGSNLNNHIRTHTGERPFSCDQCSASFSQKAHLVDHVRIHTREGPFSCDLCNASFSHKRYLVGHMSCRHKNRKL
ncbi:uncharacterized protein LOC142771706 [Rhipicephalus microplus]|uniref:uncharacterized protein LOC142771706 n=1 Tax=Rhipicephalus microplus TaxID=6941 RepID=UPI003F6BCD06